MTEYSIKNDQGEMVPLIEINDYKERGYYFEQARKELDNYSNNISYLPLGKDAPSDLLIFDLEMDGYSSSAKPTIKEDRLIVENTLDETFKKGDIKQISKLIYAFANSYYNHSEYKKNDESYQNIIRNVVRRYAEKDRSWLNQLGTGAKLSVARLLGNERLGRELAQNPDFMKMDFPNYDRKSQDNYEYQTAAQAAKNLLDAAKSPKYGKSVQIPWVFKAKALQSTLKDTKIDPQTFINLIETAEESGVSRSETVKTLTTLADTISKGFDYTHNGFRFDEFRKKLPTLMDKIPACKETENFFHTCMRNLKINLTELPENNLNAPAMINAIRHSKADEIMDDTTKFGKSSLDTYDLELALKYCPKRVTGYKKWENKTLQKILEHPTVKLTNTEKFGMMNRLLAGQTQNNPLILSKLLNMAEGMKLTSPEAGKFIQTAAQHVDICEEDLSKLRSQEAKTAEFYKQEKKEKLKFEKLDQALTAVSSLNTIFEHKPNLKEGDKNFISTENLEKIVTNMLNDEKPDRLEFIPSSGIKKMFMGKEAQAVETKQEEFVNNINNVLNNINNQNYTDILKEYQEKLFAKSTEEELINKRNAQASIYGQYSRQATEHGSTSMTNASKIKFYEDAKLREKLSTIVAEHKKQTEDLRLRAKANVFFNLGVTNEPQENGLREQEIRAAKSIAENKAAYSEKAQELKKRAKRLALENMKKRGVFEKPNPEDPNKGGEKITQENSEEIIKMMRDKKRYEKLSQGK